MGQKISSYLKKEINNKFYEVKGAYLKKNVPSIHKIQIEITSACNLLCFNCNRNSSQAPRNEMFTTDQMKKFVDESLSLRWRWDRIDIIGGEPTIHPKLFDLLEIVKQYKDVYPECRVQVMSNGYGPFVKSVLAKLPEWVSIANTGKTGRVQTFFHPYNVAPIDTKKYKQKDYSDGCVITTECGLGLSRYGYYACGPGASVDRMFGMNIGIKKLEDVTLKVLTEQLNSMCRYCGHYFAYKEPPKLLTKQVYSPSWERAIKNHKETIDNLTLY